MRLNPSFTQLPEYPLAALQKLKEERLARGLRVLDFGLGDPVEPTPAFIQQAMSRSITQVRGYPSIRGTQELRESIAGYLRRRFGVYLDAERSILPSSGSKEAVFHLPLLVIDPEADDRTVIYPDPGYPCFERGAIFAGGAARAMPLSGDFIQRPWELDPAVLRSTRLMWINSPHNPSGAVLSLEDLDRIASLCRRHDILLVADECYSDLYFDEPPPSLLEVALEGCLVLHSLSKRSGMTGYRSGFIAGDPQVIEALAKLRSNLGVAPQNFVNAAATVAWSDDKHVEQRRAIFRAKRDLLRSALIQRGLEVFSSEASFYLWVRSPSGDGDEYAARLLQEGIVVTPGRALGSTSAGTPWVRLALSPSLEICAEAIQLWPE